LKTRRLFVGVVFVLLALGCSRMRPAPSEPEETPARFEEGFRLFEPLNSVAHPRPLPGSKYQNLVSSDSYIIWVTDKVAEAKLETDSESAEEEDNLLGRRIEDAKRLNRHFLVFECHITSAFSDASIAYDISSFRGAEVLLMDDAGNVIEPLQIVVGPVERSREKALRMFSRTNLLVFPLFDGLTGEQVVSPQSRKVTIVVSSYDTDLVFEWIAPEEQQGDARSLGEDISGFVQMSFSQLYDGLRALFEHLD